MEAKGNLQSATTIINAQHEHWDQTFISKPAIFGDEASYPARAAANRFNAENRLKIPELGAGQGRDSLFFACEGFDVTVLGYSDAGLCEIQQKAEQQCVSSE